MSGGDRLVFFVTAPDRTVAEKVARALVEEKLAACANLVPQVTSIYWWEGKVEKAEEVLVVLKTTRERAAALIKRVEEVHPYDTPEVVGLRITAGSERYLAWIDRSVAAE
ncbi:MAG: divalent-cation tolerance protein CutA [Promethearchaeota archaeon]